MLLCRLNSGITLIIPKFNFEYVITERVIKIFALLFPAGMMLLVYGTFLTAYFNSSRTVLIYVNCFGESDVEFIVIPIFVLINLVGVYLILRENLNLRLN